MAGPAVPGTEDPPPPACQQRPEGNGHVVDGGDPPARPWRGVHEPRTRGTGRPGGRARGTWLGELLWAPSQPPAPQAVLRSEPERQQAVWPVRAAGRVRGAGRSGDGGLLPVAERATGVLGARGQAGRRRGRRTRRTRPGDRSPLRGGRARVAKALVPARRLRTPRQPDTGPRGGHLPAGRPWLRLCCRAALPQGQRDSQETELTAACGAGEARPRGGTPGRFHGPAPSPVSEVAKLGRTFLRGQGCWDPVGGRKQDRPPPPRAGSAGGSASSHRLRSWPGCRQLLVSPRGHRGVNPEAWGFGGSLELGAQASSHRLRSWPGCQQPPCSTVTVRAPKGHMVPDEFLGSQEWGDEMRGPAGAWSPSACPSPR